MGGREGGTEGGWGSRSVSQFYPSSILFFAILTCSHKGVLKTRSFPNTSRKPTVQRKTPPNATSSPKMICLSEEGGGKEGGRE